MKGCRVLWNNCLYKCELNELGLSKQRHQRWEIKTVQNFGLLEQKEWTHKLSSKQFILDIVKPEGLSLIPWR